MNLSPDETIIWQYGFIVINATLVWTWFIMAGLVITSVLVTRKLTRDLHISHWQSVLEMIVLGIKKQIKAVGVDSPKTYIFFLGTLFLFIAGANLSIILPFYDPPTGSLSTTAALAICVFFAVPYYSILEKGFLGYLKTYVQPTFIMLPFNIISQLSRTLALAIRLFGNIMSGGVIVAVLLSVSPFLFPVIMKVLGLLTGMVQAYIFSILATVYIASATRETKNKSATNT